MSTVDGSRSDAQLLRIPYHSAATGEPREFLLYLPVGYETDKEARWPVILFLHGWGERGDGLEDLDYTLIHGPLAEAWIQRRDLPFIMIGPQLPVFDVTRPPERGVGALKPVRLASGAPPRLVPPRPTRPMVRATDPIPLERGAREEWGETGAPGGWQQCAEDLLAMLDSVLGAYRADPDRVYLTGLSYGGYGSWYMAAAYPDRWAAVVPICGDSSPEMARKLAQAQTPVWAFHGGRDDVVKAQWVYDVVNALEAAGHSSVAFTIHEDLGHDCWTRVYGGTDLYDWLLSHRRR